MASVSNTPFQVKTIEPFQDTMQEARKEYDSHYKTWKKKADDIDQDTQKCTDRYTKLQKGRLDPMPDENTLKKELYEPNVGCIDRYVAYSHIRDEALRVIAIYDRVIRTVESQKSLDSVTMGTIQAIGIDLAPIKTKYDKVFNQSLGKLRKQQQEFKNLYEKMRNGCPIIKAAMEPLARHLNPGGVFWNITIGSFDSRNVMKGLVNARRAELAAEKAQRKAAKNQQPAEEKTA